jgi:hypothetical protein
LLSTSTYNSSSNNNSNNQILNRFLASIKSDETRRGALTFINAFMKYWQLYEVGDDNDKNKNKNKNNNKNSKFVYRYDWLLQLSSDVPTLQDKIIQFIMYKTRQGLGAKAIENYTNHLRKFYRANGVKVGVIDWDLIKSYIPENVKKTQDREYYANEVIAIEEQLDVRGKVVSGVMRGSGVRRGAEQTLTVGDLFPVQTTTGEYGKMCKIWVYRGTRDMYATLCTPEVAKRIDDYFAYRMRFGECCDLYERRVDHKHEYFDGRGDNVEVVEVFYKADERHLDPLSPLVREDFDRNDPFAAKYPRSISKHQINDIIRIAAEAAGVRKPNEGEPFKRHRVMLTHGFRKLFKKRCGQAKVDAIILERFMGRIHGNPRDGITKLMMTYDPEDWAEMQQEFEKAIPSLTIAKDAMIQAELEQAKAQLRNVPRIEEIQDSQRKMLEQMQQKYDSQNLELENMRQQTDKLSAAFTQLLNMKNTLHDFEIQWRENEVHNPSYRHARMATEELQKQADREAMKKLRQEEKTVKDMLGGDDGPGEE